MGLDLSRLPELKTGFEDVREVKTGKSCSVWYQPWQGAHGEPITHLPLLAVLQKGFASWHKVMARFKSKWNSSGSTEVSWRYLFVPGRK